MGVKLKHILGIFLIIQLCSTTSHNALTQSANLDKNDTEANQIEKLPKTVAELNTVDQENTQPTSQDTFEPNKTITPSVTTQSTTRSNADNKENVITQESNDRENSARSIDIEKFQNNVYSHPVASEESFYKSTTNKYFSNPKFDLTTPKTLLFDQKYLEARQKLEQEYEENSHELESHEAGDEDDEPELGPDYNSTLDYKEQLDISKDKNSNQNSFSIEQVKKVHYFSNSTFKYDSTQKPVLRLTEKSVVLTKPTANKNNSYIFSNKIESETLKAVTNEATTEKQKPSEQLKENSEAGTATEATTELETTTDGASTTTQYYIEETTTWTEEATTVTVTTEVATTTEETTAGTTETAAATTTESIETTPGDSASRVSKGIDMEETQLTTTELVPAEETTLELTTTELPSTTEASTTTQPDLTTTESPGTTPEAVTDRVVPTTVEFIHVETRNNHTTLVPDTLSPDLSYPTTSNGSLGVRGLEQSASASTSASEHTTEEASGETAGSSVSTEGGIVDDPEENKGKIIAIVISSVGAVCLILLAGLLYIMRKRQSRFNYKQRCRPVNLDDYSVDNISVYNSVRRKGGRQSKRSYGNPAFDDPVVVSHPLNYPALAKFAATLDDVRAEFEEIPQISAKSSELPEGCEPKNRYANVIPLPETRVFLKTVEGYPNSDYINANFVTGPKNTRGYYIATQAPLETTVDDFWRMIWEQQSKVILMMTHLFENGVEKSVDYLPPSEVLDCHRMFGDYQVTLKKRDVKEKYVISSLQLKNMVSNSWREITHFWYIGWPEKGVPTEGNSLIAFLIEARSFMKSATLDKASNGNMNISTASEVNPVVVHCSPGTGRTGVVIACDIAIRDFEQTRFVDIPKIVYRIRRDRASSVQTKEQYMFIYKVVSLYATKLTGGSLDSF